MTCFKIAAMIFLVSVAPLHGQVARVDAQETVPPYRTISHFEAVPALLALPVPLDRDSTAAAAGMPAWLKWGLIGGTATAAVSAVLSQMSIAADPPSAAESAARGFAIGFVLIGGGVAVYQAVCKPGGWSKEHGLCDPAAR